MNLLAAVSFFALLAAAPAVFADGTSVTVTIPAGTGVPGCEETDECFVPSVVSVDVGGTVTWVNEDNVIHTVYAGDLRRDPAAVGHDYPNGFQSGLINANGNPAGFVYAATDLREGAYPYHCSVHPWMAGMLHVGESKSTTVSDDEDESEEDRYVPPVAMVGNGTIVTMPAGTGIPGCEETDECFVPASTSAEADELSHGESPVITTDTSTYNHPAFSLMLPNGWEPKAGEAALATFYHGAPWNMRASVSYASATADLMNIITYFESDCLWPEQYLHGYDCSEFEWITVEITAIDNKRAYVLSAGYPDQYRGHNLHRIVATMALIEDFDGVWSVYITADTDVDDQYKDQLRTMLNSFNARSS